jgi:DNA-binding LacI/PurR family transcriptional regulator
MDGQIIFRSNMKTKYVVITKQPGKVMADYYGSDQYAMAKNAYDALLKNGSGREWAALVKRRSLSGLPDVFFALKSFHIFDGVAK